jgi:hypothetical protein
MSRKIIDSVVTKEDRDVLEDAERKAKTLEALEKVMFMKSVVIVGRRWFDKANGNTYNTAKVYVDGVVIASSLETG